MGKYPALTTSQRNLLFDIVEVSQESGPGHQRIWLSLKDAPNLQVFTVKGQAAQGPFRETRGDWPTLEILQDVGYLRMQPRQSTGTLQIALTRLVFDYYRWYQRPRLYKTFSSWWADLSGEERGVIITLAITLIASPLAGVLFEWGRVLLQKLLER